MQASRKTAKKSKPTAAPAAATRGSAPQTHKRRKTMQEDDRIVRVARKDGPVDDDEDTPAIESAPSLTTAGPMSGRARKRAAAAAMRAGERAARIPAAPAAATGGFKAGQQQGAARPPKLTTKSIVQRAIRGGGASTSAVAGPSSALVDEEASSSDPAASLYVAPERLLKTAHDFFHVYNQEEKRQMKVAAKRLQEMKAINRRGGDKDGFMYVVPKTVKRMAEQMKNNGVISKPLASHFQGEDVNAVAREEEGEEKPMKRTKRRSTTDGLYQFQVFQKWTRNAESFLKRGSLNAKKVFSKRGVPRSVKKM